MIGGKWIKNLIGGSGEAGGFIKSKKGSYIIIIVICLGLLALVWDYSPEKNGEQPPPATQTQVTADNNAKAQLNRELSAILGQIEGVGKVKVSISLASEGEKNYASNSSEEKSDIIEANPQGGEKQSTEIKITRELAVSAGSPLLIEDKYPEVTGVLVVAQGAENPAVKEKLAAATATLLNIPAHKVSVMPGKGGDL